MNMQNLITLDTKQYPVSIEEFKRRFPDTTFGAQIPFADFGYAVVFPTPKPACEATQTVREGAPRVNTKGTWEQVWEIVPNSVEGR